MIEESVPSVQGMIRCAQEQPNLLRINRAAFITKESQIQIKVTLEGQPSVGEVQIRQVAH